MLVCLLSNSYNESSYIATGLERITSVRVNKNLELLVNEESVEYRTMVNILATLKSPCAKGSYLIQKFEPVIGWMYCPKIKGTKFK